MRVLTMRCGRRRSRDTERGAVAILVAVSLTMLLIATAMVLDFGLIRLERQQVKLVTDAAVTSGLQASNDGVAGKNYSFRGVCAALAFLRANEPTLDSLPDGICDGSQDDDAMCDAGDSSTHAVYTGTTIVEGVTTEVTIKMPYMLNDGAFAEEDYPSLGSDVGDGTGCDQLGAIVRQSRKPGLGSLATSGDLVLRQRSVGRIDVTPPTSPFALLILERDACAALSNNSGGAGGRIDVLGFDNSGFPADPTPYQPGMIHVDSDGRNPDGSIGDQCTSKPIIEGKFEGVCPDADPDQPTCGGIVAHEAGPLPGVISVVGQTNVTDGNPEVYAGPYPGTNPEHRAEVTRRVVDEVYLEGVTAAVASAQPIFQAATTGTTPAGFDTPPCPSGPGVTTYTQTKVFLKGCGNINKSMRFENATDIIFPGQVAADSVTMPKAENVYVVGGTSPAGITVGTEFSMNDSGDDCPDVFDINANRAKLFLLRGQLKANGGHFRACNTTVVLMGGDPGACLPSTTPASPLYVARYTDFPCPGNTAGGGLLSLGGNVTVDWTAPNLANDLDPDSAGPAEHLLLEDLALWGETSGVHTLGGGGTMHLAGVFSLPSATPFKLNGGPTQDVKNSQYVVRRLETTGGGRLAMQPLPSLPLSPPTVSYSLVR